MLEVTPIEGYIGLTLAIPVFLTALVAIACAFLFVITAAIGATIDSRWVYTLTVVPVVAGAAWLLETTIRRIRKLKGGGDLVPLHQVAFHGLGDRDVGSKAKHLGALYARDVPVSPGWVLCADVFASLAQKQGVTLDPQDAATATSVQAMKIPWRLGRRLHRLLESSTHEAFLLRSSFMGEDGAEHAFPGMYESVRWTRSDGKEGLLKALREVWSSYWTDRAITYRESVGDAAAHAPRLAVLIQGEIAHVLHGVAASCDVFTGYRERHLIEVATPEDAWTGHHDLLTDGVATARGCAEEKTPDTATVRHISQHVGSAEMHLGQPTEIEWGVADDIVWVYQARALTALDDVRTLTQSGAGDVPRYPLTPLSRAFLSGDAPVARLLSRPLERLGLPPLPDEAVQWHRGRMFLDVTALRPLLVGSAKPTMRFGLLLRLMGGIFGRGSVESPKPPPPLGEGHDAPTLVAMLDTLRATRLVPAMEAQMEALQLAASIDALLTRSCAPEPPPTPRVDRPDMGQAWYRCERDAELADSRQIERDEAAPNPGPSAPAPDSGSSGGSVLVRVLARIRDRLLTERETLNARINAINYEARRVVLALDTALGDARAGWKAGDVFYCTLAELRALAGVSSEADAPSDAALRARETQYGADDDADVPGTLHLGPEGEVLAEEALSLPEGVVASGLGLGRGAGTGALRRLDAAAPLSAEEARGLILIIDDPRPSWGGQVMAAAGVIFERGGPLSHLALLCREHDVPALLNPQGDLASLAEGTAVTLDAARGTLVRGG